MGGIIRVLSCTVLFLNAFTVFVETKINFSSRDSSLKIKSGTILNVGNSIQLWDGTLFKEHGSSITGQNISFDDGILRTNTHEGILKGLYDTTGDDTIRLEGGDNFNGQSGTVYQDFTVQGDQNRLEGQPLFSSQIEFLDSNTTLTIAIQGKLNQNINLNGGTLVLEDDLGILDERYLLGPGVVRPNGSRVLMAAHYDSPWATNLIWDSSADVVLSGRINLTANWTFVGDNVLNGNGHILDLTNSGQIEVASGSTLRLIDVDLRSVQYKNIKCEDDSARIILQNTIVNQINDFSFDKGTLLFEQDVVITGTKKFSYQTRFTSTIDSNARLTLDSNVIFSYEPSVSKNNLLYMKDVSSCLFLNGCSLYVTKTGLQLTRGSLLVDRRNYLYNENSPVDPE